MGIESAGVVELELIHDLGPDIEIVGQDHEPENTREALYDPFPKESHVNSAHDSLIL